MKRNMILLSVGLLLMGTKVNGQDTTAFSIRECIEYAKTNSSRIKVASFDEDIAQKRVQEIKATGLPQANINGNFEDRLKLPQLIIPNFPGAPQGGDSEGIPLGYQYNTTLAGEVTQMIYNPSFWVGLEAAKSSTKYYEQATEQVTEQTAYNIASAYYQTIVVKKQLDLLQSNLENTRKILAITQLQFDNGIAKQVDVNRLRVNTSNLESRVRQAELNLEKAENLLQFQMGMPIEQSIVLSDTVLTFSQEDIARGGNTGNFTQNRLDYQLLETNLELERLNKRNINTGYQPSLSAYGNYAYQAQGPELGLFKTQGNDWVDFTTSSIGLRVRIPVFDGFQKRAQSQQSVIRSKQIQEQMELTKQSINLEVSNAEKQYVNAMQRIKAEEENVELARQVYEVTQLEFREGVGTSTAVVEAETSLRQAQNTYISTLLDLYTARLDLEKAKGNLLTYISSN